ncbi:MAG TPA: GNAT family N-acetyltransferase [Rhodopila sp.]|uniref:GNAT family N-acetyltransferase n=1 Tax=Rhodopila sp. TaxID=2480087 RepID=UPI002C5BB4C9|nr:GNAT family N-acetyltransferase [Rhodopila sp.]HVY15894.1 GNAT family N-acetyltransferase [Rhodopila sp.]
MERAHVRAWPALRTAVIEGWLWRASGGGSQRANSVSTIDFIGNDPEAAIDAVEARYRAEGMVPRFQLFDESEPRDLSERLRRRGYRQTEATVTLFKRPITAPIVAPVGDIEARDHPWDAWRSVYLGEITESRRAINTLILDGIQPPARFFGARLDGRLAATALCVIEGGCAVVECVATASSARRRGAGRMVMQALENWAAEQRADWLGLQVVATNAPALGLYEGLGFQPGAHNTFWMPPD